MTRRFDRGRPPPPDSRLVTSLSNPLVKDIRALAMRKTREETGLFLAEGLKLVADAIERGWPIRVLVYRAGEDKPLLGRVVAATRRAGGEVVAVTQDVLEKLSRRDNPQTVLGVFQQRIEPIEGLKPSPGALWVALDRVRDPGNLGTIIRTADAAGAEGVMLIGETTDPFGLEAVRASMGSIFALRLAAGSEAAFLVWRKAYRGRIVGTHLAARHDHREPDFRGDWVLLMGNEQQGLTDGLAAACDDLVLIRMREGADSLNLAVATGIMLFEMAKHRLADGATDPAPRPRHEAPRTGRESPSSAD